MHSRFQHKIKYQSITQELCCNNLCAPVSFFCFLTSVQVCAWNRQNHSQGSQTLRAGRTSRLPLKRHRAGQSNKVEGFRSKSPLPGYRRNVGICLINSQGHVFAGRCSIFPCLAYSRSVIMSCTSHIPTVPYAQQNNKHAVSLTYQACFTAL